MLLGCWGLPLAAVAASTVRIEQFKDFYRMYEQKTRNTDGSTDTYPPIQDGSLVHWLAVLVLQVTLGE
jgi:hypothetical protein